MHELNLSEGLGHDDISPGAESGGQYNGYPDFNQFNGQFYNPISTSAHLLNGKTIANNHHNRNSSNVKYLAFNIAIAFIALYNF